jgi:hypothetical protein
MIIINSHDHALILAEHFYTFVNRQWIRSLEIVVLV